MWTGIKSWPRPIRDLLRSKGRVRVRLASLYTVSKRWPERRVPRIDIPARSKQLAPSVRDLGAESDSQIHIVGLSDLAFENFDQAGK